MEDINKVNYEHFYTFPTDMLIREDEVTELNILKLENKRCLIKVELMERGEDVLDKIKGD